MNKNNRKAFIYRRVRVHPVAGESKRFECRQWRSQTGWWLVPHGMGDWIPAATKADARKKIDEWHKVRN